MHMPKWLWLLIALPALLAAQPQRPFGGGREGPWWDSPIVQNLNLSEDQKKQIRATVKEYREHVMELRSTAEKADSDLREAMNESQVDAKKANDAIERLAAARGDMTRTLSQMSLKLRNILTADQWQELQRRQPPRFPGGRMRRPGEDSKPAPGSGPGQFQ